MAAAVVKLNQNHCTYECKLKAGRSFFIHRIRRIYTLTIPRTVYPLLIAQEWERALLPYRRTDRHVSVYMVYGCVCERKRLYDVVCGRKYAKCRRGQRIIINTHKKIPRSIRFYFQSFSFTLIRGPYTVCTTHRWYAANTHANGKGKQKYK